ncbi:septum formation family protein [Demequina phytophila]|uniref:septum formation family protein n=1 Tax=Demequina phytophila TaxID=1638981 RepID=UPI00078077F5|nr:septum formation family protein [Demequina phytophila]
MSRLLALSAAALLLAGCAAGDSRPLAVGDCLTISGVGDSVRDVPVVACDGPHEAEVYATFDVTADQFDEDAIIADVEAECVDRFDAYVGEPYRTSSLDIFYTYPLEDVWADGGRGAVCAAFAPDPESGVPVVFEGTLAG